MKCPLPLLQAIADLPEEALHRSLAHLQGAEFLYETRLFPEREYTFKHALTHEVAYGSLLQERRRVLHARIVEALEALYCRPAGRAGGPPGAPRLRGEVWDKALIYCRQAGAKAMARSAYREAVAYFEQALAALQHLPEGRDTLEQAIDLRLDLRNAFLPLGEQARSSSTCATPKPLPSAGRSPATRTGCLLSVQLFLDIGDHDRAIAAGQRALALATPAGISASRSWPRTTWASLPGPGGLSAGDGRLAADHGICSPVRCSMSASAWSPARRDLPWPVWPGAWPNWGASPRAAACRRRDAD